MSLQVSDQNKCTSARSFNSPCTLPAAAYPTSDNDLLGNLILSGFPRSECVWTHWPGWTPFLLTVMQLLVVIPDIYDLTCDQHAGWILWHICSTCEMLVVKKKQTRVPTRWIVSHRNPIQNTGGFNFVKAAVWLKLTLIWVKEWAFNRYNPPGAVCLSLLSDVSQWQNRTFVIAIPYLCTSEVTLLWNISFCCDEMGKNISVSFTCYSITRCDSLLQLSAVHMVIISLAKKYVGACLPVVSVRAEKG